MTLSDLQNYHRWVGQSPALILREVKAKGGWETVFPKHKKFPVWASRVRNYFNITPFKLKRLSDDLASLNVKLAHTYYHEGNYLSLILKGKESLAALALSGDVYEDDNNRFWFQMSPGSAVYHYKKFLPNEAQAILDSIVGQKSVPIFKLICPDGSGGSCELCLHNGRQQDGRQQAASRSKLHYLGTIGTTHISVNEGKDTIGKIGEWVDIQDMVVTHNVYKGSYNYSETIKAGYKNHDLRDIKPHNASQGFYVDPPLGIVMELRRFPERDLQGNVLAKMS